MKTVITDGLQVKKQACRESIEKVVTMLMPMEKLTQLMPQFGYEGELSM